MDKVRPQNLLSLKYGYNLYGKFVLYRLDTFSDTIAHDYSSQGKHGKIDTATLLWDLNGLKVTAPTTITLPQVNLNEGLYENQQGRFTVSFNFKASSAVPSFVILRRTSSGISVFELLIEWQLVTSTYFLKYRNEFAFFNI